MTDNKNHLKNFDTAKKILNQIHADYHKKELINPDPLQFLHDYSDIREREIAALVGALLAYGRVEQILKAVAQVLETMHHAPFTYLTQNRPHDIIHDFADFKYRFTKGEHIAHLLMGAKDILDEYGSLHQLFLSGISLSDRQKNNIIPAMTSFIQKLKIKGNTANLAADPAKGSACKRNNLFLRWMVRHDDVDPGGWKEIPPAMLIIPLDTHMHHAGKILGFTTRKQADMKTAIEITEGFRRICPEDPVKYDFSLTRFGIRPDMSVKNLENLITQGGNNSVGKKLTKLSSNSPKAHGNAPYSLPPLITGTLIKRYKRFLADVKLKDGTTVTAHCPNSGSMRGCCEPGRPVHISVSDNPRRKLKYTWELLEMPHTLIGINTQVPNRLVKDSIEQGLVPELSGYTTFKSEIKTSDHTRLDILLTKKKGKEKEKEKEKESIEHCYVEVKNCTLVENRVARFPDAVTTRGQKHLLELERLVKQGHRGVIFFLIQRMDADVFMPAADIDPEYARILYDVQKSGVEIIVRSAVMTTETISMGVPVPLLPLQV